MTKRYQPSDGPLSSKAQQLKYVISKALRQERMLLARERDIRKADQVGKFWQRFAALRDDLSQSVTPQNFIIDMLINIIIVSGESYAQELFSAEDKAEEDTLTGKIKKVQQQFKDTQNQMKQKTGQLIKNLSKDFSTQAQNIKKTLGYAQEQFAQEVTYVQRMINLSMPPLRFIVDGIPGDLFFKAAPMKVPGNYPWYNVYQIPDWAFDPVSASFIQRGAFAYDLASKNIVQATPGAPAGTIHQVLADPGQWRDASNNVSTVYAEQNQIFTEYFTNKSSYQVQAEITLINVAYPFCAGIIFNRARWLAGSLDRASTYRLVGLYGTQQNSTPKVGLYLGQTSFQSLGGVLPVATSPLHAIAAGTSAPLYTFAPSDAANLGKDPVVFRITLVTQELSVYVSLEKKTGTTWQNLYSGSVANFDPAESKLVFWYHGIGFMAPGCQASFKIIAPPDLAFSSTKQPRGSTP